jgi:hypothetical protein
MSPIQRGVVGFISNSVQDLVEASKVMFRIDSHKDDPFFPPLPFNH